MGMASRGMCALEVVRSTQQLARPDPLDVRLPLALYIRNT